MTQPAQAADISHRPAVLFVCVHNAGRSQMAAGYLSAFGGDRVQVLSAGSEPADQINPTAVEAMAEEGIDIGGATPKILTTDAVRESDVVITMGCGDTCPIFPGKRYEDWQLDDPAGLGIDAVRPIRNDIKNRIVGLLGELLPAASMTSHKAVEGTAAMTTNLQVREHVRERYAAAATTVREGGTNNDALLAELNGLPPEAGSRCAPAIAVDDSFGSALYTPEEQNGLPAEAIAASLGCGNPTAVADLKSGERVLDLGSGGGIDVLLSARRVGPTGFAYGVDMTDEMLDLARDNLSNAGVSNVEFLKGTIEEVPLPDASVDVVISNCVINLSTDKPAVLQEMFRVLLPGGRIGISDVVADDNLSPADRAERGTYVGCIAGALSRTEYLDGLIEVGFVDPEVTFTHESVPGMHSAIVRAVKPS
jgi:arsenite methyltransferase